MMQKLLHTLDDGNDDTTGPNLQLHYALPRINKSRSQVGKILLHNALSADFSPDTTGPTLRSITTDDATGAVTACGSNFCATGNTGTFQQCGATAMPRGDTVHVAVLMEAPEDGTSPADSLSNDVMQATAETQASPESRLLRIPYRSMTSTVGIATECGVKSVRAVVDSGAAQSAVSRRTMQRL